MALSYGDVRLPDGAMDHEGARVVRRFKEAGRRVVERLERRRAEGIRRNPERLVQRLRRARHVLVLCQGNVIRSVFAAHLLSAGLAGTRRVSVRSAGLETVPGWRAHPYVRTRCEDLQIDLSGHSSVAVTDAMVETADVVLVMEVFQLVVVSRRFHGARRKTFLLSCLAPDVSLEIRDPAGKDEAALDACLDQIARALRPVIDIVTDRDTTDA